MLRIETVLDAYITTNILLILAFVLWSLARFGLERSGRNYAFSSQLKLLNGVFLAIMFWPVAVIGFGFLIRSGAVPEGFSLNAADFVVAQYLDGRFVMNPSDLERVLLVREQLTGSLLGLNSPLGIGVVTVFAAGFLFCTLRMLTSMVRLSRIISASYAWRRFGRVQLRLSDTTNVPFSTRGLCNRYVVLPSALLTDNSDMRMVLAHEFQHLRKSDLEWEIGLEILRPLFFWNPVFHMWKRRVEHLRELACDQQVVAQDRIDVTTYCKCLLRVCQDSLQQDRSRWIAIPRVALVEVDRAPSGATVFLRQRIESMFVARTPQMSGRAFLMVFAPLALSIAIAAISLQKSNDWSQDRIMLTTIINLDRLAARNTPTFGTRQP